MNWKPSSSLSPLTSSSYFLYDYFGKELPCNIFTLSSFYLGGIFSKILKTRTFVLVTQDIQWLIIFFCFCFQWHSMVILHWIFDLTRNSFRLLNVFLSFCQRLSHYILYFGKLIHFYNFSFNFYECDSQIHISSLNFLEFQLRTCTCLLDSSTRCDTSMLIPKRLI